MFEEYKKLKRNEKFSFCKKENLELQAHLNRPSWLILQESVEFYRKRETELEGKTREFLPSIKKLAEGI